MSGRPDRRPDPVHRARSQRGSKYGPAASHGPAQPAAWDAATLSSVARRSSGRHDGLDAIVVGAGPNGLAAAITLARAGRSVRVYEAAPLAGGGTRTAELTLPGFRHDVCSTILPLTIASPFFASIDLAARGLELVHPDAPFAHPFDGGRAAVLERSVRATADGLGGADGRAWRRLFGPLVRDVGKLGPEILRPVVHVPRHPLALARFGLPALRSARGLARARFDDEAARGLFAGVAAHSMLSLDRPLSASFGLVLATFAHAVGWPMVRGGAAGVAEALVAELEAAGGRAGDRSPGRLARRPAAGACRPARRHAAPAPGDRRRPAAATEPPASRALPLRPRRVQGRLGARRPGPVGRRGTAPGRDGPPRRHARRDRRERGRGRRRPPSGAARTCCSSSTRRGTRRGRRPARRPPGRTATCRPARPST